MEIFAAILLLFGLAFAVVIDDDSDDAPDDDAGPGEEFDPVS